jgi:hypothetical protein
MLHRRSTATLVAVLLPLAAALTSCGFDYPTDRVNTIAAGVNNREGDVKVLGARLVAYADGQGRLIGSFVYSDDAAEKPASLTSVEGDGIQAKVEGIEIVPGQGLNLTSDDVEAVAVTGDFTAGEVLTLSYTFSNGESSTLDVPVVKPCRQYADIAPPAAFDEVESGEEESAAPEESEAPEDEAAEDEADATYLCDHPTEHAEEEAGH